MKSSALLIFGLVAALLCGNVLDAAEVAFTHGHEDVFQDSDESYDKHGGHHGGAGAYVDAEINFMRFYQTDGVGPLGTPNRFKYEATPRVEIGYVSAGGVGIRGRYWNFSYTAGPPALETAVDTYNVDVELFERVDISPCTTAEWSAGVRYNDFRQDERIYAQNDEFGGLGLLIGLKLDREAGPGNIYGRGRWAILTDTESNDQNFATRDNISMQFEMGVGYELSRCLHNGSLLTARVGYENQFWTGFGVRSTGIGNGMTGVGFGGVVIGAAIER